MERSRAIAVPTWRFPRTSSDSSNRAEAAVAGNIAGRAFAPVQNVGRIRQDPAVAIPATVFGGFTYGAKPAELARREHAVRAIFAHLKAQASRGPAAATLAHQLNDQENAALRKVDDAYLRALAGSVSRP